MPDIDQLRELTGQFRPPPYADLVAVSRTRRRRLTAVRGLVAAAAVLAVIVGVQSISGHENTAPPVGPSPSPSPSVTYQSPGDQDHPAAVHDAGGSLVLVTVGETDRIGTATLWRKDTGGWQKVGSLEHAEPLHLEHDSDGIRLAPGPAGGDLVATGLADERVGFSRDGGATWTYLAAPPGCSQECFVGGDGDYLSAFDGAGSWWLAPFGATRWDELALPETSDPQGRRWNLLVLDDGTLLIAEVDAELTGFDDPCTGRYRISRDRGDTWSDVRELPRPSTSSMCIEGTFANVVYAYDDGFSGDDRKGHYQSTDLVSWTLVRQGSDDWHLPSTPVVCSRRPWAVDQAVRVGDEVFGLLHLNYRDGRELEPRRGLLQEGPHEVRHLLMVSHDDCRTWEQVLR